MKETTGKKVTALKAFKVIVIIHTVVIALFSIQTVYGWITGLPDNNYVIFAGCVATYCASLAIYEDMKKKEARKEKKEEEKEEA